MVHLRDAANLAVRLLMPACHSDWSSTKRGGSWFWGVGEWAGRVRHVVGHGHYDFYCLCVLMFICVCMRHKQQTRGEEWKRERKRAMEVLY